MSLSGSDPSDRVNRVLTRSESSAESERKGNTGDAPMNITFNISTPDADSFKRSGPQIKADAYRAMKEAYARNK
jgi:hypothetical protein